MYNIVNYVEDYGKNTFQQSPFNKVDNLILAEMTYLDYQGILLCSSTATPMQSHCTRWRKNMLFCYKTDIAKPMNWSIK